MNTKQIKVKIREASEIISREISGLASHGKYAAGLASEGYAGGYRAALQDVLLVLDDVPPCVRPDYWPQIKN